MTTQVEERIHAVLQSKSVERTVDGYRLVHPGGAGVSSLRFVPVDATAEGQHVVAVAEILAEYAADRLPRFNPAGLQRLNALAVHGAYQLRESQLRQTAQFSLYSEEPSVPLAVWSILNAFGGQLPLGQSVALAVASAGALEQQRAHHAMPVQWKLQLGEAQLQAVVAMLQAQNLAADSNAEAIWVEVPLSGDCPSRSIDPDAETAFVQLNTATPHPIAGAGYLATIALPLLRAPPDAAAICSRLNALELSQVDFIPRLGAWGLQGPNLLPGYSCFIPCAEPYGEFHANLIWWCVLRAAWLRDRFWVPKRGLTLDGLSVGRTS